MSLLSVHADHAGWLNAGNAFINVGVFEAVLEVGEELSVSKNPVLAVIFRVLVRPDLVYWDRLGGWLGRLADVSSWGCEFIATGRVR